MSFCIFITYMNIAWCTCTQCCPLNSHSHVTSNRPELTSCKLPFQHNALPSEQTLLQSPREAAMNGIIGIELYIMFKRLLDNEINLYW